MNEESGTSTLKLVNCAEMVNCEATLLREIADGGMKQKDVASTYGLALLSSERDQIDWTKVNQAIIARWGHSGLVRIKTEAWRLARSRAR
jgi:hypothetical protein